MMEHNDELYLKQTVGNRNPFRVPEGYFEQLTEQVMNSLPDVEVAKQEPIAPVEQHRAKSVSMLLHVRFWHWPWVSATTLCSRQPPPPMQSKWPQCRLRPLQPMMLLTTAAT